MREFLEIDLAGRQVVARTVAGEELARAGRYLIARMLNDEGVAGADPLGPDNPLIFSAGPFAGTNLSNANRISVGCRSPLTGGIKEANSGGTFATAMGQAQIAGMVLRGQAPGWVVLHVSAGGVRFDDGAPYMGKGVFDTAAALHAAYGQSASLALIGPVAEYGGLMAGISFSDVEGRPSRLAARGGVGAVMASKKVKAIVIDKGRMPPLRDMQGVMEGVRGYSKALAGDRVIQAFTSTGTAMVADLTNHLGALPVRNFSAGRLTGEGESEGAAESAGGGEVLKLGGDFIRAQNAARGGKTSHACMRGCKIKCSNVYADASGEELVSPLEYETLGLLGANCGLSEPDDVARLNREANDLGVDTIELGATIGVLMEAGLGAFGDADFMARVLAELRAGSEAGRLYAQGTARVGAHFGVARVPVIKGQAISAYDPRVVEVTGVSMMLSAQGADHTVGNMPSYRSADKDIRTLVEKSLAKQESIALADSIGLCIFGGEVTTQNLDLLARTMNAAFGTGIDADFLRAIGRETLALEDAFNRAAGFTEADDELPAFFREEALPPTGRRARLRAQEINRLKREILAQAEAGRQN